MPMGCRGSAGAHRTRTMMTRQQEAGGTAKTIFMNLIIIGMSLIILLKLNIVALHSLNYIHKMRKNKNSFIIVRYL